MHVIFWVNRELNGKGCEIYYGHFFEFELSYKITRVMQG